MREVPLSEVKDDLSRYLREAEKGEIVITRHGRPAGVLLGVRSDDDWFDYRLENDPRFLARIEQARQSLRAGRGVRIEDLAHRHVNGTAAFLGRAGLGARRAPRAPGIPQDEP